MEQPPHKPPDDCPPLDTAAPTSPSSRKRPPRPHAETVARRGTKRVPNRGSWKPGQSGRPAGTPRTGLALATAVRERLDPHAVLDLVVRYMADEREPLAARLDRLLPWLHAGFLKPPTATALTIDTSSSGPARDWAALSVDEHRELLDRLRGVPLIGGGSETTIDVEAVDVEPIPTRKP